MKIVCSRRRFLAQAPGLAAAAGLPWPVLAAPEAAASDAFAANRVRAVVAANPSGNVVFSPFSVQGAPPPLELVFDRPFALVIRDQSTLFAAVVRDPSLCA